MFRFQYIYRSFRNSSIVTRLFEQSKKPLWFKLEVCNKKDEENQTQHWTSIVQCCRDVSTLNHSTSLARPFYTEIKWFRVEGMFIHLVGASSHWCDAPMRCWQQLMNHTFHVYHATFYCGGCQLIPHPALTCIIQQQKQPATNPLATSINCLQITSFGEGKLPKVACRLHLMEGQWCSG